jgi:hypothetical protein
VRAPLARRARQRLCYGRMLAALGFREEARGQLGEAAGEAGEDRPLRQQIARVTQDLVSGASTP